jgi:hypothetical protein
MGTSYSLFAFFIKQILSFFSRLKSTNAISIYKLFVKIRVKCKKSTKKQQVKVLPLVPGSGMA